MGYTEILKTWMVNLDMSIEKTVSGSFQIALIERSFYFVMGLSATVNYLGVRSVQGTCPSIQIFGRVCLSL